MLGTTENTSNILMYKQIENTPHQLAYRTYEIVLRQLNGINKGVQAEHSAKRYMWKYRNDKETEIIFEDPENETTIMLDGGTNPDMIEIQRQLEAADIKHAFFNEPDLNYCLTAITVIADERVWDRKYFHSFQDYYDYFMEFYDTDLQVGTSAPTYEEWLEHIGGEKNVKLIEILSGKRLSL